jgi:hypothetical protein
MTFRRTLLLDSVILSCLVFLLIKPLFRLKYLDQWSSIESTFIADGRMLSEHLPHPGWQPLWYCGTRTDYIYPPAVPYGTALISRFGRVLPARAYHLYTAIFYIFGILSVYWMVRIGSRSRAPALLAAAATALLSPSFLLLGAIRNDSGYWVPQRLHVLMSYGEGPHIVSVCIIPAALAAAFLTLREWRPAAVVAAGACSAFALANNFYGATALVILYPILVWSVWVGERTWKVWLRAAAIPLLAYGLSAFWLTPSYVRITLTDLKWVSLPGNSWSAIVMLIVIVLYCLFSYRACSGQRESEWPVFVWGAALIISVYVLGVYNFGLRIAGEPGRLVPELDLVLILAGVEAARIVWKRPRLRVPLALVVLIAFSPAWRYLNHVWSPFPKAQPLENVYEYKTAKWVHDHLAGERVMPSGSVRFWFDVWSDNAQPDGGSSQGMLNQIIPIASWQIIRGNRADLAILWLRALGPDAVVVPDKSSLDRVHPGIARIVDGRAITALGPPRGIDDVSTLGKYLAEVENPARPAAIIDWKGFDETEVRGQTAPGQAVLVQETWDPAWHAYQNGARVPIRRDPVMGFMLMDVPAGDHTIQMRFETPLENRAGQFLFLISLAVIAALLRGAVLRAPARR